MFSNYFKNLGKKETKERTQRPKTTRYVGCVASEWLRVIGVADSGAQRNCA